MTDNVREVNTYINIPLSEPLNLIQYKVIGEIFSLKPHVSSNYSIILVRRVTESPVPMRLLYIAEHYVYVAHDA